LNIRLTVAKNNVKIYLNLYKLYIVNRRLGSETWPVNVQHEAKLDRNEMNILRWWGRCSQQKTCNLIPGKIGPRLLSMTNRKSHTRFRLVPKSTDLDDLEGHYALCF